MNGSRVPALGVLCNFSRSVPRRTSGASPAYRVRVRTARESASRPLLKRLGGFTLLRLASALLPIIVLPIIARSASTNDWAAFGVGQSVGTMAAVFVGLGWSLTGPPRVAGQPRQISASVHWESWTSSIAALCVAAPIAALIAAFLVPRSSWFIAAAMTLAVAAAGISPAWHIAASGRTIDLATYDVVPRIGATVASAIVIYVAGPNGILSYPAALLVAGILGSGAYARKQRQHAPPLPVRFASLLSRQLTPAATGVVGASYSVLAPTLIAVVASADETAAYSSAFRLYLIMITAILVVNQATVHWAVAHRGADSSQLKTALALYIGVAVGGLGVMTTVGPAIGRIFFSDAHAFSLPTSAGLGVAFAALALHSFLNTQRLLPFGLNKAGLQATILGAAVGIPTTLTLADEWGAAGGAAGVAIGELLVAAYLAIIVWHRRA